MEFLRALSQFSFTYTSLRVTGYNKLTQECSSRTHPINHSWKPPHHLFAAIASAKCYGNFETKLSVVRQKLLQCSILNFTICCKQLHLPARAFGFKVKWVNVSGSYQKILAKIQVMKVNQNQIIVYFNFVSICHNLALMVWYNG